MVAKDGRGAVHFKFTASNCIQHEVEELEVFRLYSDSTILSTTHT